MVWPYVVHNESNTAAVALGSHPDSFLASVI